MADPTARDVRYSSRMKVIIMRGVPGAGKSTYITQNFPAAEVCSADHFFTDKDGTYVFDASLLPQAHRACMQKFLQDTADKAETVVVDNTNIRLWEFAGYVQVAKARGYEVEIIRLATDPAIAGNRNVHGVPLKHVERMASRIESVPKDWNERVIYTMH